MDEKGLSASIRIEISFAGCCEPLLSLLADSPCGGDLVDEVEGITFLISPDVYQLSGDINISYVTEPCRKGFSITSARSISEWAGFGVCDIKV